MHRVRRWYAPPVERMVWTARQGSGRLVVADLVEHGGLARAMASVALATGIDLGQISASSGDPGESTASVSSDRGEVHVYLGADRRWFSMSIFDQSHEWASGGSGRLVDVVRVADAWRRGTGVEELRSLFPYVTHLTVLRLVRDHRDRAAGEIRITVKPDGLLVQSGDGEGSRRVTSVEAAVAATAFPEVT